MMWNMFAFVVKNSAQCGARRAACVHVAPFGRMPPGLHNEGTNSEGLVRFWAAVECCATTAPGCCGFVGAWLRRCGYHTWHVPGAVGGVLRVGCERRGVLSGHVAHVPRSDARRLPVVRRVLVPARECVATLLPCLTACRRYARLCLQHCCSAVCSLSSGSDFLAIDWSTSEAEDHG